LKLHLKTTLLVSAITLTVMVVLLLVISVRLADLMRAEETTLTDVGALSLAEHLGQTGSLPDATELERATALVRSGRRDTVGITVWEADAEGFHAVWSSSADLSTAVMPPDVAVLLRRFRVSKIEARSAQGGDSPYRVFTPIIRQRSIIGAVEISDQLNSLTGLLKRSAGAVAMLALVAIGLIALATFLLYHDLVYRPIEQLLGVMAKAKAGMLGVRAPARRLDELGRLSQEFNAMLGQIQDMTSERERQQEILQERVHEATAQLEQRNEQLAATNQELWSTARRLTQLERLAAAGQTAAQFAHEVGTPLNLISCHAQLIQTEAAEKTGSTSERAEIIVEQTDRIERIVRRMLDRTRAEASEHAPLDLNAIISQIGEATLPMLSENGVELRINLDPDLPRVAGDSDKLQQVLINLINNALDSMPQGGSLVLTTEAGSDAGQSRVLVSIQDTGCGMSREVQTHIFDPLYTTKERGKGTGLGLVVVKQVMQEHDGAITVESIPGHGSHFQLSFPTLQSSRAVG
jgi:two-component system, NtrC family, sensor kinase